MSKGGLPIYKKEKIFKRSGGVCSICNHPIHYPKSKEIKLSRRMVVHHIQPKSEGGKDGLYNLEARCSICERNHHKVIKNNRKPYYKYFNTHFPYIST